MDQAPDWWNDCCTRKPPAFDRHREPAPEELSAGDVLDDGSILLPDGTHMMHGGIYLWSSQALAASFYGWASLCVAGFNPETGDVLHKMGRWPE